MSVCFSFGNDLSFLCSRAEDVLFFVFYTFVLCLIADGKFSEFDSIFKYFSFENFFLRKTLLSTRFFRLDINFFINKLTPLIDSKNLIKNC